MNKKAKPSPLEKWHKEIKEVVEAAGGKFYVISLPPRYGKNLLQELSNDKSQISRTNSF